MPRWTFRDTNLCAIHAKRVTIMPKDISSPGELEESVRKPHSDLRLLMFLQMRSVTRTIPFLLSDDFSFVVILSVRP